MSATCLSVRKLRLKSLDTLVIDALRYTDHPTHANVSKALDWIAELKPRKAVLTNMHVDLDYQTLKRELPQIRGTWFRRDDGGRSDKSL
jgi:phosphoribosyl 1,2-cyclic phosphodiesterase